VNNIVNKVGILRRSAGAERLLTKAVSDAGLPTTGFLPSLRSLFNSLSSPIFLLLSFTCAVKFLKYVNQPGKEGAHVFRA
jgi:hypothetical protein